MPLLFYAAGFLALLSVPAAAVGLAMVFDRLFARQSTALGVAAIVFAAGASAVIFALAFQPDRVHVANHLLTWSVPPAIAAVPVLLQIMLGRRRRGAPSDAILGAVYVLSLAILVGLMFFLATSLISFLYLPSIAALTMAALRASDRQRDRPGEAEPPGGKATWLTPLLLLCVPLLAAATWFLAAAQVGVTPGQPIQRGGEIEVRTTPSARPTP